MIENPISEHDIDKIESFLKEVELFKNIDSENLKEFIRTMSVVTVGGGETLIYEGDKDSSLFILYQGRLRVSAKIPFGEEQLLAELSAREVIGEISLLTDKPRTSTVRAIRDSVLFKWNKRAFEKFKIDHPNDVIRMAKTALIRLQDRTRVIESGERISTIAVLSAGDSDHKPFTKMLLRHLPKDKTGFIVNKEISEQNNGPVSPWLSRLESKYNYLIYEADKGMSPWTDLCLRQADRIIWVADSTKSPELNYNEINYFSRKDIVTPFTDIVFIHPDDKEKISGTNEWLSKRVFNNFHHINLSRKADIERFIRFLNGEAFGVVLSGGGAKSLAYAGILRALDELNVPIDFIGGSNIGGVVGAAYAAFGSEKGDLFLKQFTKDIKRDYTLPLVSLLTGRSMTESLRNLLKGEEIEDLWTRFFCVSANITKNVLNIHNQGSVWKALRATTAIPALYPPVYTSDGDMLVEGGVMNNLPVDVIRKSMSGGKVLALNSSYGLKRGEKKMEKTWLSGWGLFFQKFNPYNKNNFDDITSILMNAIHAGEASHQERMLEEADYKLSVDSLKYNLLDFSKSDQIIEAGYKLGKERLPSILKLP